MNKALRFNDLGSEYGKKAMLASKALMQSGHEVPQGTLLSRKYVSYGADLNALRALKPGTVVSEKGIFEHFS